jgi:hypothetical protein
MSGGQADFCQAFEATPDRELTMKLIVSPSSDVQLVRRSLLLTGALALTGCGGGGGSDAGTVSVPTLTITSDVTGPASGPFKLTFTFSDEISITGNGGVLPFATLRGSMIAGSFTQLTPKTYTAEILPHDGQTQDFKLTVPPGAFKNASGSASNTETYTFSQPLYTVGPEAVWTDNSPELFLSAAVTVTLTFDSVLTTPLQANQLVVTGAGTGSSISNFIKLVEPTDVYTFTYTPPSGIRFGSVTITLPKDTVTAGGVGNYVTFWNRGVNTP